MFAKDMSIGVVVSNARKSAKWFKEKLGFKVSIEGHWVTVWPTGANWKIHLCQSKYYPLDPGVTGLAFYAKDLEKEVARLKKKRVKFTMELTKRDWGTSARISDPDGNEYWLEEGLP